MRVRKSVFLIAGALILSGCSSSNANRISGLKPGDYPALLPYETSDTRSKHVGLLSDIDIRIQLEQGLMDLSKSYFDPSDAAYRTSVYLDYDELDATDMSRGLLGTLRDGNPNGLNPGSDEDFDTGNGIVKGPILVYDLYELDFYGNDGNLKGISLGLAVADAAENNGERVEIAPEQMKAFLKVAGTKVVSYMRERFNDITPDIPILVGAYQLNTDETESSKGGYIYLEYFNGTSTSFKEISEDYVLVPSSAFAQADPEMSEQFASFKNAAASILPDYTYTTGQAKVQNGKVVRLDIETSSHGKTAGEILAVIQSVRESMGIFQNEDCTYKVTVKNNNETVALLERLAGSDSVSVLTIY